MDRSEKQEIREVLISVLDSTKSVYLEWLEKEYPVDAEPVLIDNFYGEGKPALVRFIPKREIEKERKGE